MYTEFIYATCRTPILCTVYFDFAVVPQKTI